MKMNSKTNSSRFSPFGGTKWSPTLKNVVESTLKQYHGDNVDGFTLSEGIQHGHFVLYVSSKRVKSFTRSCFKREVDRLQQCGHYKVMFKTIGELRLAIVVEKSRRRFAAEVGIFSSIRSMFDNVISVIQTIYKIGSKHSASDVAWILADILGLLLELRDGYLTPTKILRWLCQSYSLTRRVKKFFQPESFDGYLAMMSLMFPREVMDAFKNFSALSGKRVFDSTFFIDQLTSFLNLMGKFLTFLKQSTRGNATASGIIDSVGTSLNRFNDMLSHYHLLNTVVELYSKFMAKSDILFDPRFRQRVVETHKECLANPAFMEMASSSSDKYFTTTWNNFKTQLLVSVKAFDASKRSEPICIVLEGQAGSGKSVLMNNFVEALRAKNMSVYTHIVPSTEEAKDFYDDYNNQDVFVMDDVGAAGKSQWRTIVNFVSPVKVPLPCATASLKNTKFFNSKIIICTTNHLMDLRGFTSSDCIAEPEALFRRPHVISVTRAGGSHGCDFKQALKYYKFDHKESKTWKSEFLYHNRAFNIKTECNPQDTGEAVKYLWTILAHLVKTNEIDARTSVLPGTVIKDLPDIDLDRIAPQCGSLSCRVLRYARSFWSHPAMEAAKEWLGSAGEAVSMYSNIMLEWSSYWMNKLYERLQSAVDFLIHMVTNNIEYAILGAIGVIIMAGLAYYMLPQGDDNSHCDYMISLRYEDGSIIDYVMRNGEWVMLKPFTAEAGEIDLGTLNGHAEGFKHHHSRLIVFKDEKGVEIACCNAIMSGNHMIIPHHVSFNRIDVYASRAHYESKHKELEDVETVMEATFPSCDMSIFAMKIPCPYRRLDAHRLFPDLPPTGNNVYINAYAIRPLICGVNFKRAQYDVTYSTTKGKIELSCDKWETPFSGPSLCGSVVIDASANIRAFHVAGDGEVGIAVQPGQAVVSIIRDILSKNSSVFIGDRDAETIHPGLSGSRVRYADGTIQSKTVIGKSNLVPTIFNERIDAELTDLKQKVIDDYELRLSTVPRESFREKHPATYYKYGSPPKTMKELSKKTFKHQGDVTDDEVKFVKKCVNSLLCDFTELSWEETAFGSPGVPPIDKNTSNGYGCLPDKTDYLDYENRKLLPAAVEILDELRAMANEEIPFDFRKVLSVESFKDELRVEGKIDTPRTFRIMPLPHIMWSKRIFGSLTKHMVDNRLKTGVGIGLNPYVDFDEIARQLKPQEVTGDIDFSKWDGSINRRLMDAIGEVLLKRYKGAYGYMIPFLVSTASQSMVLIGDELWATTHGLPSGCWFTLLMNCLFNKAITALTIYRNKSNPTVRDFQKVVDFVVGDDKLIGASGELANVFNLHTINDTATSLGMTCTNGDKTPIVHKHQPFEKLTFVKRHFRYNPEFKKYVGMLDLETLFGTLQYVNKKSPYDEAILGKANAVLIESRLHSKSLSNEFRDIFDKYPETKHTLSDAAIYDILSRGEYKTYLRYAGKPILPGFE
jgi:GTPase SAR1 family protein